ncbi:MAG: HAD family phosphatase [bacterium]
MNKFKAVIYDMDGLLVDSMIHWIELDKELFSQIDFELTEDTIKYLTGRSVEEGMAWLKEKFNIDQPIDDLFVFRNKRIEELYQKKTKIMPGVVDLIRNIKKEKIKQAIASGAPLDSVKLVVGRFGWHEYFDELVSADHVNFVGKPDPRIYLYTAERLQVKPEDCLVFEDAENGVVSAKRAGMTCIAVPDKRWSFGDFSQADLVVDSLEDKKISKYLGL